MSEPDDLMRRAYGERDPRARLPLLLEAAAAAAAQGDAETELEARLEVTSAATHGVRDLELAVTSFAASLAVYDAHPEETAHLRNSLYWQFKWMASDLARSPDFALEDIDGAIADMEARFRSEGLPDAGVATARFAAARLTGNTASADAALAHLRTVPRDDFSDCEACEASEIAQYAVEQGRDDDALDMLRTVRDDNLRCTTEPAGILAATLGAVRRAGRLDEAASAVSRVVRAARRDELHFGPLGRVLLHLAVIGDLKRGLDLLTRHASAVRADPLDGLTHLRFLTGGAALLVRAEDAGWGDRRLTLDLSPYVASGPVTIAELAREVPRAARALAARFDARNGNDAWTRHLEADLAEVVASGGSTSDPATELSMLTALSTPAAPTDAAGWLALALALEEAGCPREADDAARAGLAADPTPLDRVGLLGRLLASDAEGGGTDRALRAERLAALDAAGLAAEAEGERILFDAEDLGVGSPEMRAAIEAAVVVMPDPGVRARLLGSLAWFEQDDPERCIELLTEAIVAADAGSGPLVERRRRALRIGLAESLLRAGRTAEAAEVFSGTPPETLPVSAVVAIAVAAASEGDTERARGLVAHAITSAERLGAPRALLPLLDLATDLHLDLGEPELAAATAIRARGLARLVEGASAPVAGYAQALAHLGRADEAIDELLQQMDQLPSDVPFAVRGEVLESLARLSLVADEPEDAIEYFLALANAANEADHSEARFAALRTATELLVAYGEPGASIDLASEVLELARVSGDLEAIASARRLLIESFAVSGESESAIELVAEALAASPSEAASADLLLVRARLRDDGAAARTDALGALRQAEAAGAEGLAADADALLAALALDEGDVAEAEARYRSALARPENTPPFVRAVALALADLLSRAGRPGEAADFRRLAEEVG